MATQNETMTEFVASLSRNSLRKNPSRFSDPNVDSFRNMVNYLTSLRKTEILNNENFTSLLLYACSIFIENEVEEKVSKLFTNKLRQVRLFS